MALSGRGPRSLFSLCDWLESGGPYALRIWFVVLFKKPYQPAPELVESFSTVTVAVNMEVGKYRKLLKNFKMLQSMSARNNYYENSWTESFIGTMKKEMDPLNYKQNPQKLRLQCFRYKEDYYNTQIKHSSLGYYSIPKFESIHALY